MRKLNIASIVLSLVYSPLMLIKIYYSKAVLPGYDSDGNLITVTNIYRYSVLDNLSEMINGFGQLIVFLYIILCAILLSTGILGLIKKDNKELQLINKVLLILASIIFVVLIIIGFTYIRCY